MEKTKYIIWDWNGTLLDDVDISISSMNKMLRKRDLSEINRIGYRNIFTFPVVNYYRELGFNFDSESFADLAAEYIDLYMASSKEANLYAQVIKTLETLCVNNCTQIILSAMEQKALKKQVSEKNIGQYFSDVIGLNNIHAKSKIDNARQFLKQKSISQADCIVIGDTFHDYEVAAELDCNCVLINNGHQNLHNFQFGDKVKIISDMRELCDILI